MQAFIADLHLQREQDQTLRQALDFLAWAQGRCEQLFILGDLFEYWLGDDSPQPGLQAFDAALRQLARGGCAITLLHGNRDFLLGEDYCTGVGARLVRDDTLMVELGGRRALLLHGDTLCSDDLAYQAARVQLRSRDWQAQFCALPVEARREQALALRRRSRDDSADKPEQIMDVTEASAAALCAEHGVDLLIHGHTHRPHWHQLPNYERVVLGDWSSGGAVVALYDNHKLQLKQWPSAT